MSKNKIVFYCTNCDRQSFKWFGCCPECNEWNSAAEQKPSFNSPNVKQGNSRAFEPIEMVRLKDAASPDKKRILSGCHEWDRVLGGGIMPGSFLILTGDPGIGKSTLLLQIAHQLSAENKVYYFSSEESLEQVKQRSNRIVAQDSALLFSDVSDLEAIIATCEQTGPDIIIVDSIQNCYVSQTQTIPGSIGQLREVGFRLMRLAKEKGIAVIATGHITKDGNMAGPKTLEHLVDAVFYFQGEDQWHTRVLRSVKNRFGAINEIGFFELGAEGLKEIPNINEQLLQDATYAPGSILISCLEGSRPLLIELQALTIPAKFGVPQRVITGVDHKRVILIAAILEKYLQVKLSSHDIFFKVSGGFTIKESSADLGIALALLSTYFQQSLPPKSIALGEISLTGNVKPINHIVTHANEAQKFGIEQMFVSKNQKLSKSSYTVEQFGNVYELMRLFVEDERS